MTKQLPRTLGELKSAGYRTLSVKDEIRNNLIAKLRAKEPIFTGIVGYEETVIPQVVNAILARQNFILLGLRGQAKTKILRELGSLLDPLIPVLRGSEINEDPLAPVTSQSKKLIAAEGDQAAIDWLARDLRYVEKLATPDTTVADLIGDVDPIKAARGGHQLSDELTMHFGLVPRANRGIFCINEVPDLASKVQVGLFNIMQEGDIQIKGYPVRLPLDILLVFSANPEDYTARGKIITPLKDRIGAEIRTHYPHRVEEGVRITKQEAWVARTVLVGGQPTVPSVAEPIWEIIEQIAFFARSDRRIDQRSGVSQRLPISVVETVVSNAERRALFNGDKSVVPRISDIYAAAPAVVGKIELEYEGEQIGVERIVAELIRKACGEVFRSYFGNVKLEPVVEAFSKGATVSISELTNDQETLKQYQAIAGLEGAAENTSVGKNLPLQLRCELILEGLHAQRRLSRQDRLGGETAWGVRHETETRLRQYEDSDETLN